VESISVGLGSKELQHAKWSEGGGGERKETLADKSLDFENLPHVH